MCPSSHLWYWALTGFRSLLPPQTFERQLSCLQSQQRVPATRSLRPVPWENSSSVVVRHPAGGHRLGPPAFWGLLDPQGQQALQMPMQPGSGEAAETMWTSGMRSQDSLWMRSTSGAVEISVHWCNCTTTRRAGWCVWAEEAGVVHACGCVDVQECWVASKGVNVGVCQCVCGGGEQDGRLGKAGMGTQTHVACEMSSGESGGLTWS